jgi:hypothetical protein
VKDYWDRFLKFLTAWDFPTILNAIRQLDPKEVIRNPIVWLVGLPILGLLIWKRRFRILLAMGSFVVFLFLAQATISPPGETMALKDILMFVGGTLGLLVLNLYFLFVSD